MAGIQKKNTCSVLHNAGFIIVDDGGIPVSEITYKGQERNIDEIDFLESGQKRVMSVAKNYFVEPARENNSKSVEIKVNELHDKIGLNNQYSEVVQALTNLENHVTNITLLKQSNLEDTPKSFTFELLPEGSLFQEVDSADDVYSIKKIIEEGCFIEEEKLTEILDRLRTKKNLILQGPPGTGKTWLAKPLSYALIGKKNDQQILIKQFHQTLSYEDFIRGWRPMQDGKLDLIDGPFLKFVDKAKKYPDSEYVIIIEEINRGNPAQIFGEMLTLMETDKRSVDYAMELTYTRGDDERFFIPENLFIIGTMNIADRSLALVDLALRRRFAFMDLEPTFNAKWLEWVHDKVGVSEPTLREIEKRISELNDEIEGDKSLGAQFKIGHSYFTPPPNIQIENEWNWFCKIVNSEIKPLLKEYWFDSQDKAMEEVNKLTERT